MSRALDESVREALKNGDNRKVFAEISSVLTQPAGEPLEIELLPRSHVLDESACMRDGKFIAIPKLRLVQAFLFARQIFIKYLTGDGRWQADDLWGATAVILLMDPEHLTAANTRKRLLRDILASKQDVRDRLRREKHLVDSLLTSRLHRHTKSPNLWSHRRWLMEQFRAKDIAIDVEEDLKAVVMVSGERHPRNYYAWCHARYLTSALIARSAQPEDTISQMLAETKKWAFLHHDDISGWQFLMFLLNKRRGETASTIQQTLQLTETFKWRNESVWYFLRYTIPILPPEEEVWADFRRLGKILRISAESSREGKILEDAQIWAEGHRSAGMRP
ncbi:Fc.00g031940.m01.CDS01 [Cosmosporella sp. VM-42]